MELIRKGAEADLYLAEFGEVYFPWNAEKVLIKKKDLQRVQKNFEVAE